jgi:hypothetical protein
MPTAAADPAAVTRPGRGLTDPGDGMLHGPVCRAQ